MRKTIIQASELKDDLERLSINRSDYTIFSMDAISMYPSVKFSMVKLAVPFFARDLKPHEKTTINRCLDMIRFGMGHTLLNFQDEYWEYGGRQERRRERPYHRRIRICVVRRPSRSLHPRELNRALRDVEVLRDLPRRQAHSDDRAAIENNNQ